MTARLPVAALCAGLALAAAALDVLLLRSFEFVTVPAFVEPWAPPSGAAAPAPRPAPAPPARSADGVTIVIVDGLRVDMSRRMPEWERLRLRGTDAVVRCEFPSFSRVGYAGILTGAEPRVHGYLSNHNKRPSPVESVVDLARAAGLRTRMFHEHHTWIPAMFPGAFEEVRPLSDAALAERPPAGRPHLTVVYISEPDLVAHKKGATGDEYVKKALEVDAMCGRVIRAVDLSREAIFLVTDHGHRDAGGHGGHEPQVLWGPHVAAGHGTDVTELRRLRDVAPAAARLLGLRAPSGSLVEPARDAIAARALRAVLALALVTAATAFLGRGVRLADLGAALAGLGAFALLYSLRGHPFTFSCVNSSADVPGFLAEVLALAAIGIAAGAILVRSGTRYVRAVLLAGLLAALATGAAAGPTAASALDHPAAAYLYHTALTFLAAAGVVGPGLVLVGGTGARDTPPPVVPVA